MSKDDKMKNNMIIEQILKTPKGRGVNFQRIGYQMN